jgi:CHAT domain-containing protein
MNLGNFEMANSLLFVQKNNTSLLLKDNFNQLLFLKSLTLFDSRTILQSVYNNPDSTIKKLFIDWQSHKGMLAKQYALPLDKRVSDLKMIEDKTENLEKELNRRSSAFQRQQAAIHITMENVRNKLQNDEAALEFVRFRLYDSTWTDSIIYAAYLLKKTDSVPKFIPLCEERQLSRFFQAGTNEKVKAIYRSDVVDEDNDKPVLGDSLYNLIWKPLIPYLSGVKKIDYSPAGLLYKVAFHALPANDKQLLLDQYELHQLVSAKELAERNEEERLSNNIVLFGNSAFTMDSASMTNESIAGQKVSNIFSSTISRGNSEAWRTLPGTAEEVKRIQSVFEKNNIPSVVYTQQQATEEKFKSLNRASPTFIHLATHGFFLADPEKKKREGISADNRNSFTLANDPLLRSGIILAGANRVWSGVAPIDGREDGVVTAYEISQLDLSTTNLVVLSACETALGDVRGNDGVFGLQRAFKLAGVKNMILSLWSVPDKETAELMCAFYDYYLQGRPVNTAFALAQHDMRIKYKPYFWAAFVLIE